MKGLGDRIYRYREKCGLSQLEFSELLDVSRQAVSKWETGAAMPELAKLVKMAEIFGIGLDALVLGKESQELPEAAPTLQAAVSTPAQAEKEPSLPEKSLAKTIMGCFFLAVGTMLSVFFLLWAPLFGLLLMVPFALCAFFCFKQLRYAALWCAEVWFVYFAGYLCYASGTSWTLVFSPTLYSEYTNEWVQILSWAELLLILFFIGMTVYAFRDRRFSYSQSKHISLAVLGGVALVLPWIFGYVFSWFGFHVLCGGDPLQYAHWLSRMDHAVLAISFAMDVIFLVLFTACLIPTVFWLRSRRAQRMDG